MLGKIIDAHHRAVCQVIHLVEPRHFRRRRATADVYKNSIGHKTVVAYCNFPRRPEAGMALYYSAVAHPLQKLLESRPRCLGNSVLSRLDPGHVSANITFDLDSKL